MTLDRTFYNLICKQEVVAALLFYTFFLIAFLDDVFVGNIIIILCFDYIIIKQSHYRPEVPRRFQEVKVPRLRDNGRRWW